jgi:hypothetical protein
MILDLVVVELRAKVKEWRDDVVKRRSITTIDPVADTRAVDALELEQLIMHLDAVTEEVGTADYAQMHNTSPQTVTMWARKKKIPARETPNGWLIPRDARPPKGRHVARRPATTR